MTPNMPTPQNTEPTPITDAAEHKPYESQSMYVVPSEVSADLERRLHQSTTALAESREEARRLREERDGALKIAKDQSIRLAAITLANPLRANRVEALLLARAALEAVKAKWTFSNSQQHTHTWHDWADCAPLIQGAIDSTRTALAWEQKGEK